MIDVRAKSKEELRNLVENHEQKGKTSAPTYLEALEELGKRGGKGFEFNRSMELIRKAALERRFLSYKQLADESGVTWSQAHRTIPTHLGDLIVYAHRKGWPLLSAIVVNQENLDTGMMAPETLAGFIRAARSLGFTVGHDEIGFLRAQQEAVFAWAAGGGE